MAKDLKASKSSEQNPGFNTPYYEKQALKPGRSFENMPFGPINYIGVVASILLIFIGFWVMAVDHTFVDATEFSLALNVSPVIIILGYALLVVAIMLRPGKKKAEQQ
jgi:hypothetical protein